MFYNPFANRFLDKRVRELVLLSTVCMIPTAYAQEVQNQAAVLDSSATEEIALIADFNQDGQSDVILAVPSPSPKAEALNDLDDIILHVFWGKLDGMPEVESLSTPLSDHSQNRIWKLLAEDFDRDGISDFLLGSEAIQGQEKVEELWFYRGTPHGLEEPQAISGQDQKREFEAIFRKALGGDSVLIDLPQIKDKARNLELRSCPVEPFIPWDQMTALQKHLSFFDKNGDGKVTLKENFQSLRDLGINPLLALPFAIAINGAMATPTAGYPTFTLYLPRIDAGLHGSDSGLYDNEGRFDREEFERWFAVWDKNKDEALDVSELAQRLFQETDLFDLFGSVASGGEFTALFLVAAERGKLSKFRMQALYEGGLFYSVAAARGTLGCRKNFAED